MRADRAAQKICQIFVFVLMGSYPFAGKRRKTDTAKKLYLKDQLLMNLVGESTSLLVTEDSYEAMETNEAALSQKSNKVKLVRQVHILLMVLPEKRKCRKHLRFSVNKEEKCNEKKALSTLRKFLSKQIVDKKRGKGRRYSPALKVFLSSIKTESTQATYYMNAFNQYESNPKEMWKKISDLTNKKTKSTNISEIKEDGVMLTDPTEVANSFNKFFSEIGPDLSDKLPEPDYLPESYVNPINSEFYFQTITETEVFKLLTTLKTSKATGHDRISAKLLKDSADVITKTLTQIFNKSVLLGKFPDDMKVAIISSIYKTGSKTETTNYRPVSVLSVVAKIFEIFEIYLAAA
ncbi:Hypothetical predicted protein [Paramuricea clavata]|uniref:Uncharacterized protein n=1 Tax=Paramuricea clavata TaxID=317549 RepID=A0A6S7HR07_PARCT|nr:Hypothetical predicted protein [Paramuricea clavata]